MTPERERYSDMTTRIPRSNLLLVLCVAALVLGATLLAGCTQPAAPSQNPSSPPIQIFPTPTPSPTPVYVSAAKPDTSHVIVTFNGGPDRARIIEVDATVTDSSGRSQTQHIGDRLATSPVGAGSAIRFTGLYSGKTHVFVTAWYNDGSNRAMLETDI
jgi:hypothetical protein